VRGTGLALPRATIGVSRWRRFRAAVDWPLILTIVALCTIGLLNLYSATRDVWSGAVGFRYQLARLFGMHAGVDVGVSDGETAIYLQVGNAWFRP